jgi:hypothetical protein
MYKTFLTQDNHEITIEVPPPSCTPSFFVFALHKSGSTMLNGIIEAIAHYRQIPIISVAQSSYMQGFEEDELDKEVCSLFTPTGYGFYGSRYLPNYLEGFDLGRFKKILLVRDPRDILVSLHFSLQQSHSVADGKVGEQLLNERKLALEIDIDHHVLCRAPYIKNRFEQYGRIEDSQCKHFRYEDVVFEKPQLIRDILAFLELSLDETAIREIAQRFDVFPEQEDPSAHIRKVTPGDYKQKLKPKTITQLNDFFQDILSRYQYS